MSPKMDKLTFEQEKNFQLQGFYYIYIYICICRYISVPKSNSKLVLGCFDLKLHMLGVQRCLLAFARNTSLFAGILGSFLLSMYGLR